MYNKNSGEVCKKKVLIVDDDADFVKMNKSFLELNGFEVSVAYSGKECMDIVDSVKPDIILLDMMMETWSEGTNVVDKLRRYKYTKDTPIIFITAINFRSHVSDMSDVESSINVDSYLVKPVLPETLLERVNDLLSKKSVGWTKI